MSAHHLQSDTDKKEDKLGGAGSVTQIREKAPYSLHLPAPDTALCQKTKGGCFQGYHQTGAAGEDITHRRAESETLLVTPLSLYVCQEVADRIPKCS